MSHTATLTYTRSALRKATLAFWRRTVGLTFPVVLLALMGWVVYSAANGDRSWELGALATALIVGCTVLLALYVVHYRSGLQKLRAMGEPVAEFRAEDEYFTVTSGMGTSSLKWASIQEVWRFDGFWLVLFSKAQFMTIPLQDVAPEMQAFILDRVRAAGGKA